MHRKILPQIALSATLVSYAFAQGGPPSPARADDTSRRAVACKVMEVFAAPKLSVNAIIFHQSDKTEGPRLGELLKSYSGREMEFETKDGKQHHATVYRVKSCFGRGLMIIPSGEAKLEAKDEFLLRFPEKI
jgi:hypothetical protein